MATETRHVRLDRRIPRWAAPLLARLAQDRPAVLTRADITSYLDEAEAKRDTDTAIRELVRLDWLVSSHIQGVWLFAPPGEGISGDPYLDLRAWRANDPSAVFALAGEACAWHLGYLDRRDDGPIALWFPGPAKVPYGVRPFVSVVRLGWDAEAMPKLGPSVALLRRRRLDLTSWASGLAAFGPEALLVQLAVRPSSFRPWADLVAHLADLATDCDTDKLSELLTNQSASAWQRAAYLLHTGGAADPAREILGARPSTRLVQVSLGRGHGGRHSTEFGVTDYLVAPLLDQAGKA